MNTQNTIAERLTEFRLQQRLTEALFSNRIGIAQSTYNTQVRGNNLSLQTILSVLNIFPTLSAEWLLLGVGNMYLDDDCSPVDEELKETCIEQAKEIVRLKKRIAALELTNK